jgi:hypothetical protein
MMTDQTANPNPARRKASGAEPRRPYHLGVAIGLSAGVYATSLAAVTLLQVDQDRSVAADRQPVGDSISLLADHHDSMEADIAAAQTVFEQASSRYASVVSDIGDVHTSVKRLGKTIARIEGTSATLTLPGLVSLPSVTRSASRSGSGSSGSSSSSASKPAPPPPSNGGSGASGKP